MELVWAATLAILFQEDLVLPLSVLALFLTVFHSHLLECVLSVLMDIMSVEIHVLLSLFFVLNTTNKQVNVYPASQDTSSKTTSAFTQLSLTLTASVIQELTAVFAEMDFIW